MLVMNLIPSNNQAQKSFYGKAKVVMDGEKSLFAIIQYFCMLHG